MAANVIELVIAAKDQATAQIKQVESSLGGLNSVLGAFSPGLAITGFASLGTAAAGAILAVRALGEQAQELLNTSAKTGISVDHIQAIQFALERLKIPPETAGMALRFLNKAISESNPLLKTLGITSKDTYTVFLQLSDVFRAHADDANKVAVALELLGPRAGSQLIPAMNAGSEAIRQEDVEAKRLGATLSGPLLLAAKDSDEAFANFALAVKGLKNELGAGFISTVTGAINAMTALAAFFHTDKAKSGQVVLFPGMASAFGPQAAPVMGSTFIGPLQGELPSFAPPNKPKTPEQAAREKQIQALISLLHIGKQAAGEMLDKLNAIEDRGALVEQLQKKMFIGPIAPPGFDKEDLRKQAEMARKSDEALQEFLRRISEPTGVRKALQETKQAMMDILDAGKAMQSGLTAVFDGMNQGFNQVFQGLLGGSQTFASAMTSIFKSLISAVLSELARLAAAKLFQILLSFINPVLGAAAGAASSFIGPPVPGARGGPVSSARAGGNTFIIQTIDARDLVMQLVSPGGSMRRANDRIAIGAAY